MPSIATIDPEHLGQAIALWFIAAHDGDPYCAMREFLELGDRAAMIERGYARARAAGLTLDFEEFLFDATGAINTMCESAGEGVRLGLTTSWYGYGCPTLEVGHKLAASLMATKPHAGLLSETEPPFETFLLHVPNGLLQVLGRQGPIDVRAVLVGSRTAAITEADSRWCSCTLLDEAITIWRVQRSLPDLVLKDVADVAGTSSGTIFDHPLEDIDDRSQVLLHRLIGNLILYVSDETRLRPIGRGHGNRSPKRRESSAPVRRTFQVTGDVRHDFRSVVRDYVAGAGTSLDKQLYVEGHFKQQPHGAGRSLRKRIHIEPYWRGPEDAPIALRKHVY